MKMRRPQFANANPTFSTGQLSKLLGSEWKAMTLEQQAPWKFLHERLINAFKRKFPDYQYERGGRRRRRGDRSPEYPQQALYARGPGPQYPVTMSATPRFVPYQLHGHPPPAPSAQYYQPQQPQYYEHTAMPPVWTPGQPAHLHPDPERRAFAPYPTEGAPSFGGMAGIFAPQGEQAQYPAHWQQASVSGQDQLPAPAPSYPTEPDNQWSEYLNQ